MTITTVDPVITHVVFVTELNGLLAFGKGARVIRRSLDRRESPGDATKNKDGSKYAHLGKGVRTAMENLWHSRSLSSGLKENRVSYVQ
ncbi:MAG TPA: hypothetical protein VK579_04570 [Terriglobales bacterium]|nr:hypothetical protein [Terriglobales bacterium]